MNADPFSVGAIRSAYDVAAQDYLDAFGDDLDRLPLDRAMLDEAATVARPGVVLDLGCGPGPVASYLRERGLRAVGLDLSLAMVALARRRDRFLAVALGDLRRLPFAEGAFTLVSAFYAVQHVARGDLAGALSEARRVLRPGGHLLLSAHLGEGDVSSEEFLGHRVESFGGALYDVDVLTETVVTAGFEVVAARQRGPLPHEYDSQRLYLLARRTDAGELSRLFGASSDLRH